MVSRGLDHSWLILLSVIAIIEKTWITYYSVEAKAEGQWQHDLNTQLSEQFLFVRQKITPAWSLLMTLISLHKCRTSRAIYLGQREFSFNRDIFTVSCMPSLLLSKCLQPELQWRSAIPRCEVTLSYLSVLMGRINEALQDVRPASVLFVPLWSCTARPFSAVFHIHGH